MKKRMMIACLLGCLFFATGCNGQSNVQKNDESVNSTESIETEISTDSTEENEETQIMVSDVLGRISYAGESYTWEDISITIPKEWAGKYTTKEDANGVSFYQKASNEKEDTLGFLCGIYRTNQYSNSGTGETLVAYTDDGKLYYVMKPSDVTCYVEDEVIVSEYSEMMPYVEWIAGNMEIHAENVHYDVSQYEIPVSSILPLESYHVMNMTNNQLWIARNEIYARHGRVFQNEYLASYFESCSWYEVKEDKNEVNERELNEVEIANLKLIVEAEEAYAKEHPYPKQYTVGEKAKAALCANGTEQTIRYEVIPEGEWEYQCILTIDGVKYDLGEYVTLVTPVADVYYITDIAYYDDKLEIAILDDGPSDDPVTYFFQYDGELNYVGEVQGFPFDDYGNNSYDGFTGQNSVMGISKVDLIHSAYVYTYYWYNISERTLEKMERVSSDYTWYQPHALYVDIPVYYSMDEKSPVLTMQAQEEVYFIATDCKEWILVRDSNGVEGYIRVKDGQILNIGLPAEEVFSELYFFG
ncbi:MAG: YARHG domain-containing protein [Roseburia sp.]|nr:YARHG domain-containing protein [Roseburia sp.]